MRRMQRTNTSCCSRTWSSIPPDPYFKARRRIALFSFVDENGERFDLDYDGDIYAISSDGIKVARFTGQHPLIEAMERLEFDECPELEKSLDAMPDSWDSWRILVPCDDASCSYLQRAVAMAYSACANAEYIFQTSEKR